MKTKKKRKINKPGTYKCKYCGKTFRLRYNYIAHKSDNELYLMENLF